MIYITLACEDANSKLVEVVTLADVNDEKRVGDGHFVADLEAEVLVIKLNFCSDFEHKVWSRLKFRRDFEAEFWSVFCC